MRTYALLLGRRPVVTAFGAAVLARLTIAMAPLGIVLLVQQVRGSYAPAGLVSGAFALGTAVGSPVWGRAMDRRGQSRVIVPTVLTSAALLALVALGAVHGAPVAVLAALAAASGVTFPPFSAAMRATWRALLPDLAERRAGFAMDAAAVESIFVVGPLLLSLLLVVTPPVAPLLISAGLLATGGLLYASTASARAPGHAHPVPPPVPAPRARGVAVALGAVLLVSLVTAVAFGFLDTSMAATARSVLHDQSRLGVLFAATAGGSTLGGLVYGATAGQAREHRRLPVLLGVFAAGLVVVSVLLASGNARLSLVLPVLFCLGLTISPSLIIEQGLVDSLTPRERAHEAQAWLSTSVTTGAALGTAVAGTLIQAAGVRASFATAATAVAVAAVVALLAQGRWRRPAGGAGAPPGRAGAPATPGARTAPDARGSVRPGRR